MAQESNHAFILQNWDRYKITDTKKDMIALLNILEANGESIDSLHRAVLNRANRYCGVYASCESDRELAYILFDHYSFFSDDAMLYDYLNENADCNGITVTEQKELEEITNTRDGYVVNRCC